MTRSEHLFEILGGLDDELVDEAAQPVSNPRPVVWRRWAALAACLLLVAGAWNLIHLRMGGAPSGGSSAEAPAKSEEVAADAAGGNAAPAGDTESAENRVGGAIPEQAAPAEGPSTDSAETTVEGSNGKLPSPTPAPAEPFLGEVDGAIENGSQRLNELNEDLARRIETQGLPDALSVYVNGEAKGPYPLLSREEAWAARKYGGDHSVMDQTAAADAVLCYVTDEDDVTLPCWRIVLPDGSTLDIPAVEAQYLP